MSAYDTNFKGRLSNEIIEKLLFENVLKELDISRLKNPNFVSLNKMAIDYSDAIIKVGNNIDKRILKYIDVSEKPKMTHPGGEEGEYASDYANFYEELFEEVEEGELELTE